jgi:hypothetical protein
LDNRCAPHILIDPSLLVVDGLAWRVLEHVTRLSPLGLQFSVPASFVEVLEREAIYEAGSLGFYIGGARALPARELRAVAARLRDTMSIYAPTHDTQLQLSWFQERVEEELRFRSDAFDRSLVHTIVETWAFLQSESWVIARTKKVFNRLNDAGVVSVTYGRRFLDSLERRTLKKPEQEALQTIDHLRVLAKWIAVGGPPASALLTVGAVPFVSALAGFYLLMDPPPGLNIVAPITQVPR